MKKKATTYDILSWNEQSEENKCIWLFLNSKREMHWVEHGFIQYHPCAANALGWWGLRFEVGAQKNKRMKIRLACSVNRNPQEEAIRFFETEVVLLSGQTQYVPFSQFGFDQGMLIYLKAIVGIECWGVKKEAIKQLEIIAAPCVYMDATIKGKALQKKQVDYEITLTNTTSKPQFVQIAQQKMGWEILTTLLHESGSDQPIKGLELKPFEEKVVLLSVFDDLRFGPLASEKHKIQLIDRRGFTQTLTFITGRYEEMFTTTLSNADIHEIQEKIGSTPWAQAKYQQLYQRAKLWQVPKIDPELPYLFMSRQSDEAGNAALIYLLSEEEVFGKKAAEFLKELVDDEKGYLVLPHAGNQELVHEGEFFKHAALTYDRLKHSGLLTKDDKQKIEEAFRLFMSIIRDECHRGKISNWNLAELAGVIACAAALQDLEKIDYFLYCPGGVIEHISKGILNDGWWYEASIGYNLLAMGLFLEISQIVNKWGYQLHLQRVPANYAPYYDLHQKGLDESDRIDGLSTEVWGPTDKNYRSIEMLTDSMIDYYDETGVIFGMNDSCESRAVGVHLMDPRYDLAYRLYQKPAYLSLLRTIRPEDRDLCFGVAQLSDTPHEKKVPYREAVIAEVAGIALLHSNAPKRSAEQQYQVTLKSGILGGAHGHYDRLALNSMRRFGKSFYNPENVWYAYHTFMYKFYVQNSLTHNMTVVDLKQQDPAPTKTLACVSETEYQYIVQEIRTKWCQPPYGGWRVGNAETFRERCWQEGRSVFIPDETPEYSQRSAFTEEILQRRAVVVTDDYVIVLDYLEGEDTHAFDCLYHASGLKGIFAKELEADYLLSNDPQDARYFLVGKDIEYQKTTEKLSDDPLSSAQFMTDVHWFRAQEPLRFSFSVDMHKYNDKGWLTPLRTSQNQPGLLNLAIHMIHPQNAPVFVGMEPAYSQTQQQLVYQIRTEKSVLHENKMGTWIFGKEEIQVAIPAKSQTIVLETKTTYVANEYGSGKDVPLPAVFWGEGVIKTHAGERIPINQLPRVTEGIKQSPYENRDYFGGPIKFETQVIPSALPATPIAEAISGTITIDLSGVDAASLEIVIGGDYPLGDESDHRRVVGIRKEGRTAQFATILEQYDQESKVESATISENTLTVRLKDGREDELNVADWHLEQAQLRFRSGKT